MIAWMNAHGAVLLNISMFLLGAQFGWFARSFFYAALRRRRP